MSARDDLYMEAIDDMPVDPKDIERLIEAYRNEVRLEMLERIRSIWRSVDSPTGCICCDWGPTCNYCAQKMAFEICAGQMDPEVTP